MPAKATAKEMVDALFTGFRALLFVERIIRHGASGSLLVKYRHFTSNPVVGVIACLRQLSRVQLAHVQMRRPPFAPHEYHDHCGYGCFDDGHHKKIRISVDEGRETVGQEDTRIESCKEGEKAGA